MGGQLGLRVLRVSQMALRGHLWPVLGQLEWTLLLLTWSPGGLRLYWLKKEREGGWREGSRGAGLPTPAG